MFFTTDKLFKGISTFSAFLLIFLVVGLELSLIFMSWPSIKHFSWHFLYHTNWDPAGNQFGALGIIIDTFVSAFFAVLIATPLSFLSAVCITNMMPPKLSLICSRIIELMAAIPSIIYGIWGLFLLGPFLAAHIYPSIISFFSHIPILNLVFTGLPIATTIMTASLLLAIMIYPLITAMMRDVLSSIPNALKEASYGLGISRFKMIRSIFIHYVRAGLLGSIILGLGRALGETMAVTFVIGNAHNVFQGLFMPGSTIASTIANEFTEASGKLYQSALIELALILFVISMITLLLSRYIMSKSVRRGGSL